MFVQLFLSSVCAPHSSFCHPPQATADFIRNSCGSAISVAGDVTDPHLPAKLVAAAVDSFGGLHILVNCAGGRLPCTAQQLCAAVLCFVGQRLHDKHKCRMLD